MNVYLDNSFWLGISLDTLGRLGLSNGQEISEEEKVRIESEAGVERWYEKMLHYISYRPRTESEVRRKLKEIGAPEEALEQTVDRLRGAGLLDDRRFAALWVEDRDRLRPTGERRLEAELRMKGVESGLIEEVLSARDPELELAQVKSLLSGRWQKEYGLRADQKVRRSLTGRLQRRGFNYQAIRQALEE